MWLALLCSVQAELPLPTYPECGEPDRPELCPSDLDGDWALLSYVPAAWQDSVRPRFRDPGFGAWT